MTRTKVEYASDNLTIYPAPCIFKCRYCWSQDSLWIYRTRNINPRKEALKYANAEKPRVIVISFTTDPYQPIEKEKGLTRQVLTILALGSRHQILILTKNPGLAVERDLDLLSEPNVWLGTTLTSTIGIPDEPHAPTNLERILALETADEKGVKTWVSIEPWLPYKTDPIEIIKETHEFVDWYVIGRLNYETRYGYKKIPEGYYKNETMRIIALFQDLGFTYSQYPREKGYLIKKELRKNG